MATGRRHQADGKLKRGTGTACLLVPRYHSTGRSSIRRAKSATRHFRGALFSRAVRQTAYQFQISDGNNRPIIRQLVNGVSGMRVAVAAECIARVHHSLGGRLRGPDNIKTTHGSIHARSTLSRAPSRPNDARTRCDSGRRSCVAAIPDSRYIGSAAR
jgi:hypothetical protein